MTTLIKIALIEKTRYSNIFVLRTAVLVHTRYLIVFITEKRRKENILILIFLIFIIKCIARVLKGKL